MLRHVTAFERAGITVALDWNVSRDVPDASSFREVYPFCLGLSSFYIGSYTATLSLM